MNFEDLSNEDLRAIDPAAIESALRRDGWIGQALGVPATVWVRPGHDEASRILVPYDRSFDDYLPRLREALDGLRAVYDQGWPALLVRLLSPRADILRFRSDAETPADGSISFPAGFRLFDGARSAVEAATRGATGDKRPTYGNRGWKQVRDYLATARLGQTERGSYVVTVISRLTLDGDLGDEAEPQVLPDMEHSVPFERKVNLAFVKAVNATNQAVEQFLISSDFDVFHAAVADGACAELCSAMAQMIEGGRPVEISIDPADVVAWPESTPTKARIEAEAIGPLETAAYRFKESETIDNAHVVGAVEVLSRKSEEGPGVVTVHVTEGAGVKQVRVRLEAADYDKAITAHRERLVFSVRGSLVKEGKYTWLYDASDIRATTPDRGMFDS